MAVLSVALVCAPVQAGAAPASTFDCVIDPSLTLKLGSPVSSLLERVEVERGAFVSAGQVVARLESAVEESSLALNQARAESNAEIESRQVRLELATAELGRATSLQERNVVATQRVDEVRSARRVAEQDLAIARLNRRLAELEQRRSQALLDQRSIRSPIDGVVVQRTLGPGEYAHQESHVVTIARIDPLYVETFLPIRVYGQIKVGDVANVRPDEPVGGDRKATVSVVDQVFDAASGTFGVRLALPNPDRSIPAGLRCRVTFGPAAQAEAKAAAPVR